MSNKRNESNTSPPAAKKFRYQQGDVGTMQLYLATKLADVHFLFRSDRGITDVPAHKTLLAMNSVVFEKLFRDEWKQSKNVRVTDASAAAFKEFLQFFYLSEGKLSAEHVADVMYLGNKYNVEKCVDACVELLQKDLTNENVCTTLSMAIFYDQEELMESCERRILANTADVFASKEFLACEKRVLAHILRMNQFSCSEVDVFEACMAWVRAKNKQPFLSKAIVKNHLGDSYHQIRFASMTLQEFCALETNYGAVLSCDFKTIVQLIAKPKRISKQFNTHPRRIERNDGPFMYCGRGIFPSPSKWYALNTEEKVTFSSNEVLLLDRITCNPMGFGERDPQFVKSIVFVEVNINEARTLDGSNVKNLINMTTNLASPLWTVSMRQPVLIRPNHFYTICITGFPGSHWFKSNEQHNSVTHHGGIEIKFHNDKIVDGKIVSVIWGLHFNEITRNQIID